MHSNTTDTILSLFSISLFSTPLRCSVKSGESSLLAFTFIPTAVAWLVQDPLWNMSSLILGTCLYQSAECHVILVITVDWVMPLFRTLSLYSYITTKGKRKSFRNSRRKPKGFPERIPPRTHTVEPFRKLPVLDWPTHAESLYGLQQSHTLHTAHNTAPLALKYI